MRTPSSGVLFGLLALGASGGLFATGCGQTDSPVGAVHPIVGAPCDPVGARAPADDGCNDCSCTTAGWSCTERSCDACQPGETLEGDCTTCSCVDGKWGCTANLCEECPSGFADCDGDPSNGCETDVMSSEVSCGSCGNQCVVQNATAICFEGVCTAQACDAGYADCDADPANGCETSLESSPGNCGGCGNVCVWPNGSGSCTDGHCAFACDAGYADCNGVDADGCETNVDSDANHCGLCGNVCPFLSCFNGSCAMP